MIIWAYERIKMINSGVVFDLHIDDKEKLNDQL